MLEQQLHGQVFGSDVTISWDSSETATITNNTTGEVTSGATSGVVVSAKGQYTITVGSKTVSFELYWETADDYYQLNGNVLTFKNLSNNFNPK